MPWDAKRDALREDASYLVQTSAIDSLSAFPGDDTLAAAMRLSASRHPLVRGYAYICVGTAGRLLGDEERAGLRNRLSAIRETDTFAKICLLESLIHLGDERPAAGLIRMFGRGNYRDQCAICRTCIRKSAVHHKRESGDSARSLQTGICVRLSRRRMTG